MVEIEGSMGRKQHACKVEGERSLLPSLLRSMQRGREGEAWHTLQEGRCKADVFHRDWHVHQGSSNMHVVEAWRGGGSRIEEGRCSWGLVAKVGWPCKHGLGA